MSLWAIVPVKPLRRGKSRLAGVLSEEERTLLNYTMYTNTLRTLSTSPEIDQVLVISRDSGVLALARDFGAHTVQEDGTSDLNTALTRATVVAQMYTAHSVLILPADLPLIDPDAIHELASRAENAPVVAISPDRRLDGTNALLINPVGLFEYQFGPDSFHRHLAQAETHNLHVEICKLPALGLDLDLPEDLELLRRLETLQVDL